jgi:hypothetical protein
MRGRSPAPSGALLKVSEVGQYCYLPILRHRSPSSKFWTPKRESSAREVRQFSIGKVQRLLGKPTPQSRISTSAGCWRLVFRVCPATTSNHDDNRQISPQCLPVSPRPASTAATCRPVKVVLASTASLPVVAVWPVVSTTTVPTSTSTTLVTSVRLV